MLTGALGKFFDRQKIGTFFAIQNKLEKYFF